MLPEHLRSYPCLTNLKPNPKLPLNFLGGRGLIIFSGPFISQVEQRSGLRHGQGDPRDPRFDTSRDDGRTGHHRELIHVDLETNRRSVHEGYFDITRKVKGKVSSFDGKIDVTTFSDWIVAMEDYF